MTRLEQDQALVRRICTRPDGQVDAEALDFLVNYWARYCHEIDDIVDGDRKEPEAILGTFALAAMLFSHPFYVKHLLELRRVVLNVTSMYADTVAWEKSSVKWQQAWSDYHRHCSSEMCCAVAMLMGGYEHARRTMPEMRVLAYCEHHDRNGKAI